MPTLLVQTNVKPAQVKARGNFVRAASGRVAALLGKPEAYVMVSLDANRPMSFGGTEDPCAFVQLLSLGKVGGEANRAISEGVAEIVEEGLGVSPDRCYLHIMDVPRSDFGFKGDTFA